MATLTLYLYWSNWRAASAFGSVCSSHCRPSPVWLAVAMPRYYRYMACCIEWVTV